MRKIGSFFIMLLLATLFGGNLSAADRPTVSKADGSADVWYHIRLENRVWGVYGRNETVQGGTLKAYYYDQGIGKLLMNIEDTLNVPGTRWKVVETSVAGEYQLISGLGNTIDFGGGDAKEQFYTTAPGSQLFTIGDVTTDAIDGVEGSGGRECLGLTQKNVGGFDKSNGNLYFGKYGPDGRGGAITFQRAADLSGTHLVQPADLNMGDVPAGKERTKKLTVVATNMNGNLTYSIDGAGFTATAGPTTAIGGSADIKFAPTERKAYTATLTITGGGQSVKINLTGNANFNFPIEISSGNTEHWYYIQFERQIVNNKALQANQLGKPVTQELLRGNENKQLWKIIGEWDQYRIVNKTSAYELAYNQTDNRYITEEDELGNWFAFDRYEDTGDWQLRNVDAAYLEGGAEVEARRYLNDMDAEGDSVSNYTPGDAGNRLAFIPAATPLLIAGVESLDFGSIPANTGSAVKKTVQVSGLNLTAAISARIDGPGAAAFSLKSASVPAAGGELEVTFTPTAIDIYNARLILSAAGAQNDTVLLKGRGSSFPFRISSGSNEYWYYIQFVRHPAVALTANGIGETVTQTAWSSTQAANDKQIWKVTGTWDNFKFVAKTGGELITKRKADGDGYEDYTLAASGNRFIAIEKTDGTHTGWGFQNVEAKEAGDTEYMNDYYGEILCSYGDNDEGFPLNFISASNVSIIPGVSSIGCGEVRIGLKSEKTLSVSGRQTTANITYALAGSGASAFKITNTTEGKAAGDPLPAAGGTLKIAFEPVLAGEYIATLTLSSTGAEPVIVVLTGTCLPFPDDFPVKISDNTSTTWYTVYFNRAYTSSYSWKAWTGGLIGDIITQTTRLSREDPELTTEEQLWKFVVAPEKNGYLIVSYNNLEAATGTDYTLQAPGDGTPLVFTKNPAGAWVMKNMEADKALNDRDKSTVCEWSSDGSDSGCPMGFVEETSMPDPVRIQPSTRKVDLGKTEAGYPARYSDNVTLKKVGFTGNITLALSGSGASAYSVVHAKDSAAVSVVTQTIDTLKIVFNPAERQVYNATLTLTAEGAPARIIELTGNGNLKLPAKLSTAEEPIWYFIGFERQSTLADPPKAITKVFTAEGDTIFQRAKTEDDNAQLWRIEGTPAAGYLIINKNGLQAVYDSTATVKDYLLDTQGDRFRFEPGTGNNVRKMQLLNISNTSGGSFLNDRAGNYLTNYNKNDAGNWIIFTPFDESGVIIDAIVPVEADANDPVISSAYYNLQGIRIQQPVIGTVHIRIDTHASRKTTATKILLAR